MYIYPAIDLRGGRVVRLRQGDYGDMTVYGDDPVEQAKSFASQGATRLHIVDLDAAGGEGQLNIKTIEAIAKSVDMFIEVGGGAREETSVKRLIDAGADRVIIGSMAIENTELMFSLAKRYKGVIAAGVDARDGYVAIHGWRVATDVNAFEFIKSLPLNGVNSVIYTDIARDGMLMGPNVPAYEELSHIAGLNIIASGGVTTIDNVKALAKLGIHGAIIGKALYDGGISLVDAIKAGEVNV